MVNTTPEGPEYGDELSTFLLDRLSETLVATEGTGRVAWLTYRDENGSMLYTTVAAGGPNDNWVVNGREVFDYAHVQVIYDEDVVRADLDVKLDIVRRYRGLRRYAARPYDDHPDPSRRAGYLHALEVVMEATATALYSEHHDYREEWSHDEKA